VNPPALGTGPVARATEELDWGEDVNRVDARTRERDPSRPRKKRRVYGAVSLIPGLDDFYLGLIVLGVIWLVLAVMLILSPRFCMVAIIIGGVIWACATFWLNVCVQEADPYWKIPFFTPFATTPLSIVWGQPGLFVLGFIITQLWAAFFAMYFRDRALRAFVVTCLAMLISGMGWAAMPRTTAEDDGGFHRPGAVQDFGP
jgi:TM2 domain-containing membrane protein YozV